MRHAKKEGFTLIELLIVIAVIAVLAAVAFVGLNPLERFRDARDASRWQDLAAMTAAIKLNQIDNGGSYLTAISNMTQGEVYMIGTATAGCDDQNAQCDLNVTADGNCVDLRGLVNAGQLGEVPVSPNGSGTWTTGVSGYTLVNSSTGVIEIQACESEGTNDDIRIVR